MVLGFVVFGLTLGVVALLPDLASLYRTQAVGSLARGVIVPLLMALALASVPPEDGGTAVGIYQATYALGMTTGPFLTGVLIDRLGSVDGFLALAAVALLGAFVTFSTVEGRR